MERKEKKLSIRDYLRYAKYIKMGWTINKSIFKDLFLGN